MALALAARRLLLWRDEVDDLIRKEADRVAAAKSEAMPEGREKIPAGK